MLEDSPLRKRADISMNNRVGNPRAGMMILCLTRLEIGGDGGNSSNSGGSTALDREIQWQNFRINLARLLTVSPCVLLFLRLVLIVRAIVHSWKENLQFIVHKGQS